MSNYDKRLKKTKERITSLLDDLVEDAGSSKLREILSNLQIQFDYRRVGFQIYIDELHQLFQYPINEHAFLFLFDNWDEGNQPADEIDKKRMAEYAEWFQEMADRCRHTLENWPIEFGVEDKEDDDNIKIREKRADDKSVSYLNDEIRSDIKHLAVKLNRLQAAKDKCEKTTNHKYWIDGFDLDAHPECSYQPYPLEQNFSKIKFRMCVCANCEHTVSVEVGKEYMKKEHGYTEREFYSDNLIRLYGEQIAQQRFPHFFNNEN